VSQDRVRDIQQVAMYIWCDELFIDDFNRSLHTAEFQCRKFWKSISIRRSYGQDLAHRGLSLQ